MIVSIFYGLFQGKAEDRKPLLILFSEDAMSLIWNAAM
jgi:hypothetical protein